MGGEAWRTAAMNEQRGLADVQSSCWMESELASCKFNDLRHGKRLRKLLAQLAEHIGGSIPWASQDWANTKAAYRFFSNPRISEEKILGGHVQATVGAPLRSSPPSWSASECRKPYSGDQGKRFSSVGTLHRVHNQNISLAIRSYHCEW